MKITIAGDAKQKLADLAIKSGKLAVPTRKATLYMERKTKMRFLAETDPDGGKWAALKPSTLIQKKTSAILRETASLVNSIASESSGTVGRVYASTAYGIFHQTGTEKMPAREFLGIGADDETAIEKIFNDHFGL